MRLFTKPMSQNRIEIKKKEPSIEEQEKELLHWESQYEQFFDKAEKNIVDKLKRRKMYKTMFSINLQTHHNKNINN
jgi:hypothetical protein